MATTGSSTLSPMKQLHALHPLACRSPTSMPLSHPCKLVFVFHLPTRLNPITSTRHRLPRAPPFCGHGELEIVSVKELADGFLHFSFGAPSNANKVDELASTCGEHLAGKLSVPRRLPSKFSKKSPIPVAAMKRRKRQGKSLSKERSAEAFPLSVTEPVKLSSRPKSSFVKRSPIPRGKSEHVLGTERVSNGTAVHDKNILTSEGTGSIKVGPSMRPTSKFVRNSPIPTLVPKHSSRHVLPSAHSNPSPNKVSNAALTVEETSSVSATSRPKSNFSRRSPIVKVQHLSPEVGSTRRQSSPTLPSINDSSKVDVNTNKEASAQIPKAPEGSPHLIVDLEKCKLPELKNLAKIKGVKGYSKLKKGELLDLLKNMES